MTARRAAAGDNPFVTRRLLGATNSRASAYGDEAVQALGVPRLGTGRGEKPRRLLLETYPGLW